MTTHSEPKLNPLRFPERRYRMTRLRAGDYLCPDNSGEWMWRFHTHEDGSAYGLDVNYEVRQFWRALKIPMETFRRKYEFLDDVADEDVWGGLHMKMDPWTEVDWYLPTRKAAIEKMLASDDL